MSVRKKAFDEIVDFFARGSSSMAVLRYHPSAEAQEGARYLLAKNKAGTLSAEEAEEPELLGDLEHFMQLVKARAHQYVE